MVKIYINFQKGGKDVKKFKNKAQIRH